MSRKQQMQDATQSVGSKASEQRSAGREILETLKQEHEAVKKLLTTLEREEDPTQRKELVRNIAAALVPHTVAEEKVVYQAVIEMGDDKDAQRDGYEGKLEHEWASQTLQRLQGIGDATSAEHKAAAKVLKELVEHHVKEEESNIWRDIRKHCSNEDRERMNAEFLAEKSKTKVPGLS